MVKSKKMKFENSKLNLNQTLELFQQSKSFLNKKCYKLLFKNGEAATCSYFCPRGESGGKKGKNAKYSHFHWGQVPFGVDTLGTTGQGSKQKFLLKTLVYTLKC